MCSPSERTAISLPGAKQSNILSTRGNVGQHLCVDVVELHGLATLSVDQIPSAHLAALAATDNEILLHYNASSAEAHYWSCVSDK